MFDVAAEVGVVIAAGSGVGGDFFLVGFENVENELFDEVVGQVFGGDFEKFCVEFLGVKAGGNDEIVFAEAEFAIGIDDFSDGGQKELEAVARFFEGTVEAVEVSDFPGLIAFPEETAIEPDHGLDGAFVVAKADAVEGASVAGFSGLSVT